MTYSFSNHATVCRTQQAHQCLPLDTKLAVDTWDARAAGAGIPEATQASRMTVMESTALLAELRQHLGLMPPRPHLPCPEASSSQRATHPRAER